MIAVSDWELSNTFYRDVLGAEIDQPDERFGHYRFGDWQLNVHVPGFDGLNAAIPVAPGNSDLCFVWPGSIEDAIAHLEQHGVAIEAGPLESTSGAGRNGRHVYFRDPDGSPLEFVSYPGRTVTAKAAAWAWVETWSSAWPLADVEAIDALYAGDAVFYSHPFRDREAPLEYVRWAFADQAEAECRFGEPVMTGDRAAVDWWAVITSLDGSVETIAGTSLLRFGDDGLVVEQRDVWAAALGRHELPDWAR